MADDRITAFDATTQKCYEWIDGVAIELGIVSRKEAYRILRAGLHALRDQLDTPEAVHLSAQLPLLLRGVYFEGWVPGGKSHVRSDSAFAELFMRHHGGRPHARPEQMIAAVGSVLARHIGEHETEQALERLAVPVRSLFKERVKSQ